MAATQTIVEGVAKAKRRSESIFYPLFALSTAVTILIGFGFTYFGPMASGNFAAVSVFVHVHGWSFFLCYLLFLLQAVLVAAGRYRHHMVLGRISVALACVMVVTGFFVLAVRMNDAVGGGESFFLKFLRRVRPLILLGLTLFTIYYAGAVRAALTGRMESHKRRPTVARILFRAGDVR